MDESDLVQGAIQLSRRAKWAVVAAVLLLAALAVGWMFVLTHLHRLNVSDVNAEMEVSGVKLLMPKSQVIDRLRASGIEMPGMGPSTGYAFPSRHLVVAICTEGTYKGLAVMIESADPDHLLFGIRVGDSMAASEEKLHALHFRHAGAIEFWNGNLYVDLYPLKEDVSRVGRFRIELRDPKFKNRSYSPIPRA